MVHSLPSLPHHFLTPSLLPSPCYHTCICERWMAESRMLYSS